jgi:Flp pilus assembly protein TadG
MLARWKKIRGDEGSSLVELALVMAFLAPTMLFGTVQIATLVYASIEVSNAAHAGAAYAAQSYIASSDTALPTQSQVTTAAENDSPEITGMLQSSSSFTATTATGCTGTAASTGNTVPKNCAAALPYVQVTVTATVVPFIHFIGPSQVTLNSIATIPLVN